MEKKNQFELKVALFVSADCTMYQWSTLYKYLLKDMFTVYLIRPTHGMQQKKITTHRSFSFSSLCPDMTYEGDRTLQTGLLTCLLFSLVSPRLQEDYTTSTTYGLTALQRQSLSSYPYSTWSCEPQHFSLHSRKVKVLTVKTNKNIKNEQVVFF